MVIIIMLIIYLTGNTTLNRKTFITQSKCILIKQKGFESLWSAFATSAKKKFTEHPEWLLL